MKTQFNLEIRRKGPYFTESPEPGGRIRQEVKRIGTGLAEAFILVMSCAVLFWIEKARGLFPRAPGAV